MIRAPELLGRSLGIQPEGLASEKLRTCSMCGETIWEGDLYVPFPATGSFTDGHRLQHDGESVICGYCNAFKADKNIRRVQNIMAWGTGAWKLNKGAERAYAFLNLPEPPFVVCISTGSFLSKMHMAWLAQVTYDTRLLSIRLGHSTMYAEMPRVYESVKTSKRLLEDYDGKNPLKSPLDLYPQRNNENRGNMHGNPNYLLKQWVTKKGNQQHKEDLESLKELSQGELWIMQYLLRYEDTTKPETP